ncbi:MAG: hypothetical protein HY582_02655 [Candidatus Omnitrophica bacterium]|nr:hypothetical protein [Candidatus Omnitrophota bacterium]
MTIVELMIVCMIVGIIISISVPALLRNKMTANEKATQQNLRAVATAAEMYRTANGIYPPDLQTLGTEEPPMIDPVLSQGTQSGYLFNLVRSEDSTSFIAVANPTKVGVTGIYSYCIDREARIKEYNDTVEVEGSACP